MSRPCKPTPISTYCPWRSVEGARRIALDRSSAIAPIIAGLLGQTWGWHFGFGFAGFGMMVGLLTYLLGSKYIPADPPRHEIRATPPLYPRRMAGQSASCSRAPAALDPLLHRQFPAVERLQHLDPRPREHGCRGMADAHRLDPVPRQHRRRRRSPGGAGLVELAAADRARVQRHGQDGVRLRRHDRLHPAGCAYAGLVFGFKRRSRSSGWSWTISGKRSATCGSCRWP